MAYSRISLNHMQQKTDLLTIAVIRKRRRWTANMAAAWIVSSGEQLCCCFLPFFICFSGQGKIPWDFLSAILCHKYHSNHSNRVIICSEWRQHLEMGEYTIDLFADISTWSVHGYSETRSRSNVWKECTHNKGHKYGIELTFCWNYLVYALRINQIVGGLGMCQPNDFYLIWEFLRFGLTQM